MAIDEELELIAKDCEEVGMEIDRDNGGDTTPDSRAYAEGETRNLYRLKIQYESAPSPEAKQTIQLAARHECEAFDRSRLPFDLASFCNPMGH